MDDQRENLRSATRYPLAVQRKCALCVITFKDLAWKDHLAQLKDISTGGLGLESEALIDRGFVWFKDRVAGYRGGVLLWSRLQGRSFRAGIQLVPLSRDQENFIREEVEMVRSGRPLRNPEAILATILESLAHRQHPQ